MCATDRNRLKEKEHVPARKEAPRKKWWDKWLGKKTEPGALRAGLNPRLPQAPMGARVKSRDG